MKVDIHQIYFAPEQEKTLDPAFIPMPNLDNPYPERREFFLYDRFFKQKAYAGSDLSGLFSHKFGVKTGLSGEEFIAWIQRNPGYDAYFVNPFPDTVYWFFNVWVQGEISHRGILPLAQEVFDGLNYAIDLSRFPRTDGKTTSYSNFWVGTPGFWEAFMDFALPAYEYMLEPERASRFFQTTYHDSEAEIFPFIMERMFSTFIVTHPRFRVLAFPLARESVSLKRGRLVRLTDFVDGFPRAQNSALFRGWMGLLSWAAYMKNRSPLFSRFRTDET